MDCRYETAAECVDQWTGRYFMYCKTGGPYLRAAFMRGDENFWLDVAEGLKKSDITLSAGQYVYTPDSQPIIGPVPEVPGFHLNCGYWMGVMVSPVVGRICADLVTGKMENQDNPLRYTRFEEGIEEEPGAFLSGH